MLKKEKKIDKLLLLTQFFYWITVNVQFSRNTDIHYLFNTLYHT